MIIYENNKINFFENVRQNKIVDIIKQNMLSKGMISPSNSEINSWINSLNHMKNLLETNQIANDCHVAIEYKIPFSQKRIDFMICGQDNNFKKNVIIIELKQWTDVKISNKSDYVITYTGGNNREVQHPSYQAKTYQYLLESFNSSISDYEIKCNSFAYLHNANKEKNINLINLNLFNYVNEFPIFFKEDYELLQKQIIQLVGKGKGKEILYYIENGKLKPSKKLIDALSESLKDNQEFMLVETQKEVYENVISKINEENNVFIVNGNPGTGKSVVAINLLKTFLDKQKLVQYVAPNSAFKNAMKDALKTHGKKNKYIESISTLFRGSKSFYNLKNNIFDWIIVDEAHRLKNKENLYLGDNQIEDIVKSSKNIVFFVDENQVIRTNDIGTNNNIIKIAKKHNKSIYYGNNYFLQTQFRCIGAQGYVNALDTVLQIRETANYYLDEDKNYEIKICDTPQKMEDLLNKKINKGYKNSKILAGYAWEWISKKYKEEELENPNNHDIKINNWSIPWNYGYQDNLWAKKSQNKRQAGCVHAVQGLEFDYCGVIIGKDLSIDENNNIIAIYENYYDKVGKTNYRGKGTKSLKEDNKELTRLIKNIYKILLTRGQKGTFIYICDNKLRDYFKKFIVNK